MRTTHPVSIVHLRRLFYINLVGGANVHLFCFFVNSQSYPYKSSNKPNLQLITSKSAWSATGLRAHWWRDAAHFIVPLLGNAQYGIAYFLSSMK